MKNKELFKRFFTLLDKNQNNDKCFSDFQLMLYLSDKEKHNNMETHFVFCDKCFNRALELKKINTESKINHKKQSIFKQIQVGLFAASLAFLLFMTTQFDNNNNTYNNIASNEITFDSFVPNSIQEDYTFIDTYVENFEISSSIYNSLELNTIDKNNFEYFNQI